MLRVIWYASDLHACGYVRGEALSREVNRTWRDCSVMVKGEVCQSDLWNAELMVFQRQYAPGVLQFMRAAQRVGVRCLVDLDDDLWALPLTFPGSALSDPETQSVLTRMVEEADGVTVSTRELGEVVQGHAPRQRVVVLRNSVDLEAWERAAAWRAVREVHGGPKGAVTIGWMASRSHQVDAPLALPAVERVMQEHAEVRFHGIGWIGEGQLPPWMREQKERVTVEEWKGLGELPRAMAEFDVGLAPLVDSRYNRGKSGIKAIQYWALGVPVVASRLPMYEEIVEDGENGFLAGETAEWFGSLTALVADAPLRRLLGAKGRLAALERWDVRVLAGQWVEAWRRFVGEG